MKNVKHTLLAFLLATTSSLFTQAQLPGYWNGSSINTTTDKALGVGLTSPRGWGEILYCPPIGSQQTGLIVTKSLCQSGISIPDFGQPDMIGDGFFPVNGLENNEIMDPLIFKVPFSFKTGHVTNTTAPLKSSLSPMFWVRTEATTSDPSVNEFETKFIVMPDGSCGINLTQPRAALDVRGSQIPNRPAAIFGSRAVSTTGINSNNNHVEYYTQQIQIVPFLKENGYNQIVQDGDQGLFFTDGLGTSGANSSSALVIAPWSENGSPDVGGLRIDSDGNLALHGTLRTTRANVDAVWWSDFVFDASYQLKDLNDLETEISETGHLPGMPSEQEVLDNGIDVAEMLALQQQKIEELTLYVIELKKELDSIQ